MLGPKLTAALGDSGNWDSAKRTDRPSMVVVWMDLHAHDCCDRCVYRLELPRSMTASELAGGYAVPLSQPLSGQLHDSYLRRVRALPEPTQRLRWSQTSTRPSRYPMESATRSRIGAGSHTECWESSATRPAIPLPTRRPAGLCQSLFALESAVTASYA